MATEKQTTRPGRDGWSLMATVGGLGYVPWAPGSWGSLVGLALGVLALRWLPRSAAVGLFVVTFGLASWVCTQAERRLGRHDPPEVILDEVWGMGFLLLMVPWAASSIILLAVAWLLFRVLDIAKPPPLTWLARLPGGWGIMADDLGAASYAVLVLWLVARLAR